MRPVVLLLVASALGMATDSTCPWITEPTVAGLLGGPVQLTMTEASCDFSRPQHSLRIDVHWMKEPEKEFSVYVKQCGSRAEHIKGIGNEAIACGEGLIVGRVRDNAFLIRVATPGGSAEVARKAAEQVAGALF